MANSKTARKPRAKSSAKPKTAKRAKSSGKSAAKKSSAKTLKSVTGKVPTGYRRFTLSGGRKINRPKKSDAPQFGGGGTVRNAATADAAEYASKLVCTDADGQPTNRARIGSVQIDNVRRVLCKSRSASAVLKSAGFKNVADAEKYADGRATLGEIGADAAELTKLARRNGDPAKTKISGRALVGALVGLAKKPAKRS